MKTNQWESFVKTVQKAWVFHSEKWIVPLWGPGDLVLCRFERFLKVLLWHIPNGGTCQTYGTRELEPAECPGFGHPQNSRVSSQTRTRHGFCPSGLYPPSTRVSIIWGTPISHLVEALSDALDMHEVPYLQSCYKSPAVGASAISHPDCLESILTRAVFLGLFQYFHDFSVFVGFFL